MGMQGHAMGGHAPDSAIDAAAAPPHALVADYRLSGDATGLDVAQRLRSRWPALPVAIITGDPGIDLHEVARLGNIAMWQKPVLPSLLVNWLAELGEPATDRHVPALDPVADRSGTIGLS